MPHFPAALKAAIDEISWTQTRLADESGLPLPQLNKYVTGNSTAGAEVVEKICKALPEEQRAEVICAYLEDRIPESGRELVKVTSTFGRRGKTPKLPMLNEPAREALEHLARLVANDPELTLLLLELRNALAKRSK